MHGNENRSPAGGKRFGIDWQEVRQRLETARAQTERVLRPNPEETNHILKARAKKLGQQLAQDEDSGARIEVVEFILAHERYAVESRYVRDVYPLEQLTPVPCTPAFVLGIVNLRGEILSVIDIKKFFELPEKGITDLNKVIVLESGSMCFGILADVIVGVHRIRAADLQPSLPTLTGIREEYLRGVSPDRTVLLDAEKLLADARITVREQVPG